MIADFSSKIVKKLVATSVIPDTEQELYIYGFFMLLSQILYFILTTILGIIFDIFLESIIFYIAFQFIRRYAGGIHASSELKCEIATTTSIFICLLCVKMCEMHNIHTGILIPTVVAAFCILIFCPLDTPEKPLTKEERKYFRKISWIILLCLILVIYIGWYFKLEFLIYPCCMSLILEGVLLVSGKTKGFIKKNG